MFKVYMMDNLSACLGRDALYVLGIIKLKLRMEMGNVSKRQQPDHRADNSRRPPIGLQCSEKLSNLEAFFSWPLNKYAY